MVGASLSELFAASAAETTTIHSAHGLLVFGLLQSMKALIGMIDGFKAVDVGIDRRRGGSAE